MPAAVDDGVPLPSVEMVCGVEMVELGVTVVAVVDGDVDAGVMVVDVDAGVPDGVPDGEGAT